LKRKGKLRRPVVAAITDLAAMHYWASRGVDVHLVTHPESIPEVRSVIGVDGAVTCVHGFTLPGFRGPRPQAEARRGACVAAGDKVGLVSGGGWGVGDIAGAVEEALSFDEVSAIVCLCGRNESLRTSLEHRFGSEPRVWIEGFTEQMSEWMAAADALVHSTG